MQLPVIDLSKWFEGSDSDRTALVQSMGDICHEIGFFYVTNHGIPQTVCDTYMRMIRDFFALPESVKQGIDKNGSPHFRGWERLGSERTNNQVDHREQVDVGPEGIALENPEPYYMRLIGPNQWPDDHHLPRFKKTINDFINRWSDLAGELLQIMSCSLGMQPDTIAELFGNQPNPYTKLICYPKSQTDRLGVGEHKDSGFLTMILQDEIGGLEVKTNAGDWIQANPLPGSFVVNIGELLQMVTHNYFVATPHRVLNTRAVTRYSSAFFYSPDLNTVLKPLPIEQGLIEKAQASQAHAAATLMASGAEVARGVNETASDNVSMVFGHKYWQRWSRSYPEIMQRFHGDMAS